MKKHILSALVNNHSGVLTRISGLFSRRGYNIESLSVCATEHANISRMTIVVIGDDYILDQITKQLDKLIDTIKVIGVEEKSAISRELLLVKLLADSKTRSEIVEIANIYKAKTVDLSPLSMTLELTGESEKLDAFLKVVSGYGIMEMARTGLTALYRGDNCITSNAN